MMVWFSFLGQEDQRHLSLSPVSLGNNQFLSSKSYSPMMGELENTTVSHNYHLHTQKMYVTTLGN
jgi:hypothetical protein